MSVSGWLASHSDLPGRDLELLLVHVADLAKATILTNPSHNLSSATRHQLDQCANQLIAGRPLAYVLGHWEFWGLELSVDPSVLVPRPETETLVEFALARVPAGGRVLDLGTGSGAIAIALKHERPDLQITATDNHADALSTARCNAARHGCAIEFVRSDWFSALTGQWAWIIANPPYVADSEPHLAALRHEPRHALTAGCDGLDDIRRIVAQAGIHLEHGGMLALEHGFDQAEAVTALMRDHGYRDVGSVNDLAGIPRVTFGRSQSSLAE